MRTSGSDGAEAGVGARALIGLCCLLALLVVAADATAATGAGGRPAPNVVVLMTDDQTLEEMRVLPNTRRLIGRRGVEFRNYFSSYPLCCPARATTLTGQYAHNHGVLGNLPPRGGYGSFEGVDNTLPVWLQRAGYHTAHIGKYMNGYGRDAPPDVPPGWDEWYGSVDPTTYLMWGYTLFENGASRTYGSSTVEDPALYQTDVYRDKAVELIRRRAPRRQPFYLSVAFLAPHSEAGREVKTDEPTVRPAPRHRGEMADLPMPDDPSFDEADVSDKPSFYSEAFPPMSPTGIALAENSYRSRAESLLAVDGAVRAIVRALRRSGELERTLIVFTSDNGFFNGQHRIPFGKYLFYEPATHVPLLMRGPGIARGAKTSELAANVDLVPTISEIAGAEPGRRVDGRSLLRFARKPRKTTRRPILFETGTSSNGDIDQDDPGVPFPLAPDIPRYQGIRTARYSYVEYADGQAELYDLRRDPHQLRSRDGDPGYSRVRRALGAALDDLGDCGGSACRRQIPPLPKPR